MHSAPSFSGFILELGQMVLICGGQAFCVCAFMWASDKLFGKDDDHDRRHQNAGE